MKFTSLISLVILLLAASSTYADTCAFRPWLGAQDRKLIMIFPSPAATTPLWHKHIAFIQDHGCLEFIRVLKNLEDRSLCSPNWKYIALDILSDEGARAPEPGYFPAGSQRDTCRAEVDRMTGKLPEATSSQNMQVMRKKTHRPYWPRRCRTYE